MQIAVVKDFAEPIPGCVEAIEEIREHGIKIGSTTGYIRSMMDVLMPVAAEKGYAPDFTVCPDEVPNGRPFPWMVYQNMMNLNVFPVEAVVKVGDTLIDIEEGLNAGTWTVGLSQTGNLMGLTKEEFTNLSDEDQPARSNAWKISCIAPEHITSLMAFGICPLCWKRLKTALQMAKDRKRLNRREHRFHGVSF